MQNKTKASANADNVLGLLNSWSPEMIDTICAVIVVTESRGLIVSLAIMPAAMVTIIVSPMARDTAMIIPPIMPGSAVGIRTLIIISSLVAPMAIDESFKFCGIVLMNSYDNDNIYGMSITPMTIPAAIALSDEMLRSNLLPSSLIWGDTNSAAIYP